MMSTGRADPSRPWNWWSDASRGGGLLGAVGSHQIDLLRYWLGEVEAAAGTVETCVKERPLPDGTGHRAVTADDATAFSLRFASGAVATVVLSVVASHPLGPRTEVWGEEGVLILDEGERLWGARARLYAGADLIVETSGRSPEEAAREILAAYTRSTSRSREGSNS